MPAFDISWMILTIVGVAAAGGLVGLDRTAVGQFMVSQPICAASLAGWMLGDAATGLLVGALLELIWLLDMPVGTFVPADSTVAAVFAASVSILGSAGGVRLSHIGLSILLSMVLAPVTMISDHRVREFNARIAQRVQADPETVRKNGLAAAHLSGLWLFFFKSFFVYLVFIPVGIIAVRMFAHMPDQYHRAMELYVKLLPLLGVALVARKLSMRTMDRFLLGGFAIALAATLVFRESMLVIVLLTAACGFLGATYHDQRT